uniref:Translation initiation factor IF-2, mitochondrial n=2 Tax=Hirondellea gigas TaxID=1518452 RepID=A0A6A7G2R2_9CRUS
MFVFGLVRRTHRSLLISSYPQRTFQSQAAHQQSTKTDHHSLPSFNAKIFSFTDSSKTSPVRKEIDGLLPQPTSNQTEFIIPSANATFHQKDLAKKSSISQKFSSVLDSDYPFAKAVPNRTSARTIPDRYLDTSLPTTDGSAPKFVNSVLQNLVNPVTLSWASTSSSSATTTSHLGYPPPPKPKISSESRSTSISSDRNELRFNKALNRPQSGNFDRFDDKTISLSVRDFDSSKVPRSYSNPSPFAPGYQPIVRRRRENAQSKRREVRQKHKELGNQAKTVVVEENSQKELSVRQMRKVRTIRKGEKPMEIPLLSSVRSLSRLFAKSVDDIVSGLNDLGYSKLKRPTSRVKQKIAELLAINFNIPTILEEKSSEDVYPQSEISDDAEIRPPLVCVMGHVDHGKTTLIDHIRNTSIAASESGGITQRIGAFSVHLPNPGKITIFDTPGHAAFSMMRARGVSMVDVSILVVAADDGIMPQTIESIRMAKRAKVPIVVAITKCDLSNAKPEMVRQQLMRHGMFSDEDGGDVQIINVSGKTGEGVQELLDTVHLLGEMQEPFAESTGAAEAIVIESHVDAKNGYVANVLVRRGELKIGDCFVVGTEWGKVQKLRDQDNLEIPSAGLSMPVSMTGLHGLASVGCDVLVVDDEKKARKVCEFRREKEKRKQSKQQTFWELEDKFEVKQKVKQLNAILKADVSGSIEAIQEFFHSVRAPNNEVTMTLARSSIGNVTEGDVSFAHSISADIYAFGVDITESAQKAAKQHNVNIRKNDVIFHLMNDVTEQMSENLEDVFTSKVVGRAEVKKLFSFGRRNSSGVKSVVAGCIVRNGIISKKSGFGIRILRDNVAIYEQLLKPISSLRHFKDETDEVHSGQECGIDFGLFSAFEEGDLIECLQQTKAERRVEIPENNSDLWHSLFPSYSNTSQSDESSEEEFCQISAANSMNGEIHEGETLQHSGVLMSNSSG